MSLDLVEIALDCFTDYRNFEKIANEIMRDEGYPNIKPLGGTADKGRDAICESYFISSEGKNISVFQYTLEDYLPGKINNTIERLNNAKVEFNELVIVTPHDISTERKDTMTREARKNYNVSLSIFDRKTLVNRLSNFDNGIFYRHFPDIQRQIHTITAKQPLLTDTDAKDLEIAMLRSSLTFTFNKEAPRVRNTIFDSLTLSVLINNTDDGILVNDFYQKFTTSIGIQLPTPQVEASLRRLASKGIVNVVNGEGELVTLTNSAKQFMSGTIIRANEATHSLIVDIIDNISRSTEISLSARDQGIIKTNTRNLLVKLFRLFGMELANLVLKDATLPPVDLDTSEDLLNIAKDNLSPHLGELLIRAFSEILRNPTEEQAETLKNWSLAYLGVQIMNLDPCLRELQATRFAKKTFILDTDFILDCLVRECPWSNTYLNLVRSLRTLGCRVIIPTTCISECILHAQISPRTYNHFGDTLLLFSEPFILEHVWNVFVKGYYYAKKNYQIAPTTSFEEYLANYYEPHDEARYMTEVVNDRFPEGVELVDLSSLLENDIPEDQLSTIRAAFHEIHSSAKKSEYREEREIKQLSDTDAHLFLTALRLNMTGGNKVNEVLGGHCYIVTSSIKYRRCARKSGLKDVVTTRPQELIAILELIGNIDIIPTEFIRLFENPLLIYAVQQDWDDVQTLLNGGIDLTNKSLPRLRWDLDQELHSKIAALNEAEKYEETAGEEATVGIGDKEYLELIRSASKRGFKKIPELETFMQALEAEEKKAEVKEEQYNELLQNYRVLEEKITYFGKRRQRYLKRIANKIPKKR